MIYKRLKIIKGIYFKRIETPKPENRDITICFSCSNKKMVDGICNLCRQIPSDWRGYQYVVQKKSL